MSKNNFEEKVLTPSFFCVGAQKAGTTALYDWLVQQPDVCLPVIKETHFFSHDDRYKLGLDWYFKQFPKMNGDAVIGEIDPEYMFFEDVPQRIRELMKAPRIVFVLRNPLDRAYSHYLMSVRRGYEDLPYADALLAEQERLAQNENEFSLNHQSYIARGRYCTQIRRFRDVFPDSEFLFVKFEDLIGRDSGLLTYEKICHFIGVRSSPLLADRSKKSNQASVPRYAFLRDFLYKRSSSSILGKLIPSKDLKLRIAMFLDSLNQKPISGNVSSIVNQVPSEIIKMFDEEIADLGDLTGLDLSDWLDRNRRMKE